VNENMVPYFCLVAAFLTILVILALRVHKTTREDELLYLAKEAGDEAIDAQMAIQELESAGRSREDAVEEMIEVYKLVKKT
jgi:hypothetical protein